MCGVQMCVRCEATLSLPEHMSSCWCLLCLKDMANRQSLTMQAAGLPRNSPRKDWPLPVLKQILTESIQETPRQLLARELWCGSGSASEWWSFQAGYTSSTAAMSMVPNPTINPALQATCAVPTGSMHSTNSCKQYLPCKPHMLYPLAACIVPFLLQSMHSGQQELGSNTFSALSAKGRDGTPPAASDTSLKVSLAFFDTYCSDFVMTEHLILHKDWLFSSFLHSRVRHRRALLC